MRARDPRVAEAPETAARVASATGFDPRGSELGRAVTDFLAQDGSPDAP
jgi:hypothetical protein